MRDNWNKLSGKAEVVGVSFEDVETQKRFQQELRLPFQLLADPQYKSIDKWGGREANNTYAKPAAFIVDTKGRLKWSYIGASASDRPPIELILKNF